MPVTQRVRTSKKSGKKSVRYEAEVYVRGIRLATKCFPTRAAAHTWHDAQKEKLLVGQDSPSDITTFGDVVTKYREGPFKGLRRSSQQAREPRFKFVADAPMARVLMRDLTAKKVDDWLACLRSHPSAGQRARESFEQELKLLSVILNWYKNEHDYRFDVPIVARHYRAAFYKPVASRQQDYYMRPAEVAAWLSCLEGRPDPVYHQIALLMVLTGLRMGEAAGLCWDAIELREDNQGCLRVLRTLSWDYATREPYFQDEAKTEGSIRTVPIEGAVLSMLRNLKGSLGPTIGAVPIFKTVKGRLLRDNTIRDNFNSAFSECRLSWSGTHIARHTFATLALITERDIGAVQAALGHKTPKVTALYAKNVALLQSRTSGKVAELIGLLPGPGQNPGDVALVPLKA